MWTKAFWLASLERAIKSLAQGVIVAWVGSDSGLANLYGLDWQVILGAGGGMALLSLLSSVASAPVSARRGSSGPSLTKAEVLKPQP